jgi:hypothetical protein
MKKASFVGEQKSRLLSSPLWVYIREKEVSFASPKK